MLGVQGRDGGPDPGLHETYSLLEDKDNKKKKKVNST